MLKLIIFLLLFRFAFTNKCKSRVTEFGTICVCDSNYCDTFPEFNQFHKNEYQIFSTSKSKLGYRTKLGAFIQGNEGSGNTVINVYENVRQKIVGFGGAFTDSTGINIRTLPEKAQKKLIDSYFDKTGIEYSLCRVPIGGTDYSTRPYTYDDYPNDSSLKHFKLQPEDFNYKVRTYSY